MPSKGLIRELQDTKGGIGSISRRSFDPKSFLFQRRWSHNAFYHGSSRKAEGLQCKEEEKEEEAQEDQRCWGNMPPDLLRDIIQRVEDSASVWPSRKDVVSCAAVSKAWREVTIDLVKPPELSGKFTFPISVKQPGPREMIMQCYIKRDRVTATYKLYYGLTSTLAENGKFLLAARKFRRTTNADYIISLDGDDMSRGSGTYVGKLRSNFLGTKFTIYESQPSQCSSVGSISHPTKRLGARQNHLWGQTGYLDAVAHISYESNAIGTRGPRRMQCTLYSIPLSAVEEGGSAPTVTNFSSFTDQSFPPLSLLASRTAIPEPTITNESEGVTSGRGKDAPLTLKNKSPRWHEQLQCWCLNFKGRVTVASVKNFQLVAAVDPSQEVPQIDQDKVLLQFGKIGKDMFTMDYRYPLSAFQAFALCLSSFDIKLAYE